MSVFVPKPKLGQSTFFPSLNGAAPARTMKEIPGQPPASPAEHSAAILAEVKQGGSYIVPDSPPPIFDQRQVVVPAAIAGVAGVFDFNLPGDYEWVALYFPTAPGATLTVGPGAPTIPVLVAGFLTLPFTTRNFKFSNTNAAAYTVYIFGGANGVKPPSFSSV